MRISQDQRAVEALPLRILIIAIIAAVSIVPAADALESLRQSEFLKRAEHQLDVIISTAETLVMEGPGSARTLALDFSSYGRARFSLLVLGDALGGPGMARVMLTLSTGSKMLSIADNPPVWIRGVGGSGLIIQTPVFDLRLECTLDGGMDYVLAQVV
jgi:hypothetical protein